MNGNRIRHMVIFNLQSAQNSPESLHFLHDGEIILQAIPGVENFEVLSQISPKNDYEYGFSMEFADMAAYQSYNNHPAHTSFVKNRWLPEVTRFLEIDFREGAK
jgi:hypothetical protein